MATQSKSGLLLPLGVIVAAVAVFGGGEVVDTVTGLFAGVSGGTEIIGEGDTAFMVAGTAKPEVDECDYRQMIERRKCRIPVLVIDAAKMPYIARNVKLAWSDEGKSGVLHREADVRKQRANRRAACTKEVKVALFGSCDEYAVRHEASFYRVEVEDLHPFSVVAENVKLAAV
ncbi:hypothetical protein [Actinokineospora iranica]|uniref:Uncharacterized protein n=1 Tax=Actinokineospora iranica TaxID=1271860 RepID=A0A1G6ZB75_9PSEU|nr:hypothetical protein [Actinokineospora iranica]SDD99939.1 hypothetical protein SAMN05216174_1282 [Actinokineospora iranica]